MQHLRVAVERGPALRKFDRSWSLRLGRLCRRHVTSDPPKGPSNLPFCELIWMPSYLVKVELQLPGEPAELACSIDGCSGSFALFQMESALREGSVAEESFLPTLTESEAEDRARRGLVHVILRGRRPKPVPKRTRSVRLLHHPYWVYYYRRRGKGIDIKVLDAATGQAPGTKIKMGIIQAFTRANHERGKRQVPCQN